MTKDQIRKLIESNQLSVAIKELKKAANEIGSDDLKSEIYAINGRLIRLNKDSRSGTNWKTYEDITINEIRKSLLELTKICFTKNKLDNSINEVETEPEKYQIYRRSQRIYSTREQINNAQKSIMLLSEIPTTFFSSNLSDVLKAKLEKKVEIKIIMLNPNEFSYNNIQNTNNHYFDSNETGYIEKDMLRQIDEYKRIASGIENNGQIEMRLWNGVIRSGLLITDDEITKTSLCRVELRLFKTNAEERPNIYFKQNSIHYKTFVNQFKTIWDDSAIIPLR